MSGVEEVLAKVGIEPGDAEQFGTKGMKWGVRKDRGHEGERAKTRAINKADKKFEKNARSVKTWVAVHNAAADKMNRTEIDRINNDPRWKDIDNLMKPEHRRIRQDYENEMQDAYLLAVHEAASNLGTNASGTRKYGIVVNQYGDWGVSPEDVKHADDGMSAFVVKVTRDQKGFITSLEVSEPVAHDALEAAGFLAHFGVLGMKWGRRRSRAELEAARSADSARAKELRGKAKETKIDSLSNQELQAVITRLNLERQFKASVDQASPGKRFVANMFKDQAVQGASIDVFTETVGEKRGWDEPKTTKVKNSAKIMGNVASGRPGNSGLGGKKKNKD